MTSKIVQQGLNAKKNTIDVTALKKSLDAARKKNWRDSQFRTKNSFSPSVIGFGYGTCPRYWAYAFRGAFFEEKFKPESAAAMENGTDSHTRIQKTYAAAEELKAVIEKEILYDDPPIRGFADVIVEVNGRTAIGDIKTIKSSGYEYRVNSMKPSESHYLQVLIYMYVENIDDGFLHYENKDTHEEIFIPIKMTKRAKDYIESVFEWMRDVKDLSETEKLPGRPFGKTSVACRYCPLSKNCWKDGDGDISIDPLKVIKP